MAAIVGRSKSVEAYVGLDETLTQADRVTNVTTFSLPNIDVEEIDVTDFDSTAKETEVGDVTYGELGLTLHLVSKEQYERLQNFVDNGSDVFWELFIKNKSGEIVVGRKGKGVVKTLNIENVEMNSAFTIQLTIKVSGKPVIATAAPTE